MIDNNISLHSSCRNRLSSQVSPSFTNRSFYISTLTSPDFLEKHIYPHYEHENHSHTDSSQILLAEFIARVECTFEAIKLEINQLQTHFVQQLTDFYTRDCSIEDLSTLRTLLQKCHSKLVQDHLNPRLHSDFAKLLKRFEEANNRCGSMSVSKKTQETLKKLDKVSNELSKATEKCHHIASWRNWRTFCYEPDSNNNEEENKPMMVVNFKKSNLDMEGNLTCKKIKVMELKDNEHPESGGILMNQRADEHFLFIKEKEIDSAHFVYFVLVNLKKNRILFSTRKVGYMELNATKLFHFSKKK